MILSWLLGRRSLENPSRPLDPWLEEGDVTASSSGVRVTRQRALTLPAWWRGVNLVSRTVAKLPLAAYRHLRPGRQLDEEHPATWLLQHRPNDAMTPFILKQTLQGHVLSEGNGYAYICRKGSGVPEELWPLDPSRTTPVRENGRLWYVHELAGGEMRRLPPEDVIHLKGLGFDGLIGHSVLEVARDALGGALAKQRHGHVFFRNSARPAVVLQHPGKLSLEASRRLKESWHSMYGGLDNSHKTAVLEEGMQAKEMSSTARDAQLIESQQFSLIDVANLLGVPPHKLGSAVNVSYKSLEQENKGYLDDSIDPWLVMWEEECEAKLLSRGQQVRYSHCILFDRFPLLYADLSQRGAFYTQGLSGGWLSADEIRERENWNPVPGGLGRAYYRPANLVPVTGDSGDPDGPDGPAVAAGAELLDVPDHRQESDYDCGPAAVQAVCAYLGIGPAARADYVEGLDATRQGGTRPAAILAFLSRLPVVTTSGASLEVADLARFFQAGQPALCPIQAGGGTGGSPASGHWVIVLGVGLGQVFLHDPAQGRRLVSETDFLASWYDQDADGTRFERYAIAVGTELLAAEGSEEEPEEGVDPEADPPADPPAGPPADEGQAARILLEEARRRVLRRVGHQAVRAAARPGAFCDWLDQVVSVNLAAARATLGPAREEAVGLLEGARGELLELAGGVTAEGLRPAVEAWLARQRGEG